MAARTRSSWDRLQDLLEHLNPGDELHVGAVSRETGLDAVSCETVLEGLARVELFTRAGNQVFVRRSLFEPGDPSNSQ